MLEANPLLKPAEVKSILLRTAVPVKSLPSARQGAGALNARGAVETALLRRHESDLPGMKVRDGFLVVLFESPDAENVALAGDFNRWNPEAAFLQRLEDGHWSGIFPIPEKNMEVRYKFVLDGLRWIEDPLNPRTEPDGFGGWNSVTSTAGL
jgi:hypothetical protein